MKKLMGLMLLVLAATQANAGWGNTPPQSLLDAHQAYVEGDLLKMTLRLRDALQEYPDDEHIRVNALSLLEKAYETHGGKVPTDWKLPKGVLNMRLSQARKADGETFRVRLSGDTVRPGVISQVQLVHGSGRVLLDKQRNIGDWDEQHPSSEYEYELNLDEQREPMSEGLYNLHIETSDGQRVDGYLLVNNLVASTTPVIRSPVPGETVTPESVRYLWDDYVSPEKKPYEWRGVWVGVARCSAPDFGWDEQFGQWFNHPSTTSPRELQTKPLKNGRYFMHVSFKETRAFGDVKVRRESNNVVVFHVQEP